MEFEPDDIRHPGYSPEYHTGKSCIEIGCNKPAGTAWTPYWCAEHDIERKKRISSNLDSMIKKS